MQWTATVSGRLVTTGDTGTCAQHSCCHGNCKRTGGSSYNWTEQMVGLWEGETRSTGVEDELRDERGWDGRVSEGGAPPARCQRR